MGRIGAAEPSILLTQAPSTSRCFDSKWGSGMYAIVIGGGKVGYYLSRDLL